MRSAWILTLAELPARRPFANDLRLAEMVEAQRRGGLVPRILTPGSGWRGRPLGPVGSAAHRRYPCGPDLPAGLPGRRTAGLLAIGAPWLCRLALRDTPAVIFAHNSLHAPAVWRIKRRLGSRLRVHVDVMGLSSLEVRDGPARGARRWAAQRLYPHLERMLLRAADVITTVNDCHAATVTRRYAPRAPVVVLRDAADPADCERLPAMDLAADGIPPAPHRLVFVGQLMRGRLDELLGALARLPPALCVQALIVGDGPDGDAYRHRVAASSALRGRVFFLGYRERRQALAIAATGDIAFSDCWSSAGFPFKLFEYMALGRAIVVKGKTQIGEVLRDGEDALFYQTVDELAVAVTRLCANPSLRLVLGRAAEASLTTAHTWTHRRAQLDAVIAEHLTGAPPTVGAAGGRLPSREAP